VHFNTTLGAFYRKSDIIGHVRHGFREIAASAKSRAQAKLVTALPRSHRIVYDPLGRGFLEIGNDDCS